jgi:4-amino-4-deoxy-L-arabinose transferase-like glycosyltransferase
MVAGTRTFSLEDTLMEPRVLDPPPTRHALFLFLLALTAVLHLGTAGWGDLYSGIEGESAAAAREMLQTHQWLLPTTNDIPSLDMPPLFYWLIILSYKIFGVSAFAARLPVAIAMVVSVALTFLIGERVADYWRGFAAGLIYLCSAGAFILGRIVMPEPVFGAFVAGAIFCSVCGYKRRKFRRAWFTGFWICASLACLTKGFAGLLQPAAVCLLLGIFFREARLRFRSLLHWPYLLLFVLIVAPWFVWIERHFPGAFWQALRGSNETNVPRWQFFILHVAWWLPASLLVLPGLLFAPRKIFRPGEIVFADALPICWMAVGFLVPLFAGERHDYSAMSMWSAFALFAATVWERTPARLRFIAIGLVGLAGVAIGLAVFSLPAIGSSISSNWGDAVARQTVWSALQNIPASAWQSLWLMAATSAITLIIVAAAALYLTARHRAEVALPVIMGSMIAIGLCMAESAARMGPFFSLADAARFLNPRLGESSQVIYEGPPSVGSSLAFYLNQKFSLVSYAQNDASQIPGPKEKYLDENFVLQKWNQGRPIYLIIEQNRVPHWQGLVTERVHIYHHVTTCGTYVVLSNDL